MPEKIEITLEGYASLNSCLEKPCDINDYEILNAQKIQDVRKGEFVKLKLNARQVFVRGEYDRSLKKYYLIGHNCSADKYIDKDRIVYTNFTY